MEKRLGRQKKTAGEQAQLQPELDDKDLYAIPDDLKAWLRICMLVGCQGVHPTGRVPQAEKPCTTPAARTVH